MSLHAVWATCDARRPFTPWLLAIDRHRLADSARRFAQQAAYEVTVEDLEVTFAETATNTTEAAGDAEALNDAIQALPNGQGQAIELLKLRELSLKEGSAAAGLSIGSLKVATHRAMAALRRTLKKADGVEH